MLHFGALRPPAPSRACPQPASAAQYAFGCQVAGLSILTANSCQTTTPRMTHSLLWVWPLA